jgi:AAA-like domain
MKEKRFQVILAATSDLKAECSRVASVIEGVTRGVAGHRGVRFDLNWWYTDLHDQFHPEGSQTTPELSPGVQNCDLLIGIFWKGFNASQSTGISSTEREISSAYASWKRRQIPAIFIYFCRSPYAPSNPEEERQWKRVQQFQRNFPKDEFWTYYSDELELEKLIRNRLVQFVISNARELPDSAGVTPLYRLYDFTKPVSDPRMFIGRQETKNEVLQGARRGDSFAVIGGTRSGKTSLLFEVKRILIEELGGSSAYVVGPVFLSTHQFPKLSQTAIYREIILNFKHTILPLKFPAIQPGDGKLFEPSITDEQAFPAFQEELENIVRTVSQDLRIVIMIDEVDELQRHEWSKTFFNNLRHLISQSALQKNISMIIAGTLAIYSLYNVAGSPFLNVISGTKKLRLLSLQEASELINAPTGGKLPSAITEHIFIETGGHPFLIQYLMKNLCDEIGADLSDVTGAQVDTFVDKFLQERQDFGYWVSKFKPSDRAVYRLIAGSKEPIRKADIVSAISDAEAANDAIELLAHLGVIRETRRNAFELGGLMFKTWFDEHCDNPKETLKSGD